MHLSDLYCIGDAALLVKTAQEMNMIRYDSRFLNIHIGLQMRAYPASVYGDAKSIRNAIQTLLFMLS